MRISLVLLASVAVLSCGGRPADTPEAASVETAVTTETRGTKDPDDERCASSWQEVEAGARYRTVGCREDGTFDLHLVELDPERWTIDVVSGPRQAMREAIAPTPARFAINASFFDVNDRAMGAIVASGRVMQRPHPVSWQSIFFVAKDRRAGIVTRDAWPELEPDAFAAVQAGPRLVIGGRRNRVKKAQPSLRSGVCLTKAGAIRFFVTPNGRYLDVHQMVDRSAAAEDEGGMGCHDAMLFDGGPSAQMFLDTPGRKIEMDGDVVPVYVVAAPSSTSARRQ